LFSVWKFRLRFLGNWRQSLYENPVAIKRLAEHNIKLHHVVGLPELLDFGVAKGYADENLVEQYREFLRDPKVWNESRGFEFHE